MLFQRLYEGYAKEEDENREATKGQFLHKHHSIYEQDAKTQRVTSSATMGILFIGE